MAINPVDLDRLLVDAEESIRKIVREIVRGRIDAQPRLPRDCKRCDVRDVCRFRERAPASESRSVAKGTGESRTAAQGTREVPRGARP
jgi:hypothetical protein